MTTTERERDNGSETQRAGPTHLRGQRDRGALTYPAAASAAASTASRALEEVAACGGGRGGAREQEGGAPGEQGPGL